MSKLLFSLSIFLNSLNFPFNFKSVENKKNYPLYGVRYIYDIYWGLVKVGNASIEIKDVVEISKNRYAYVIYSVATSSSFIDRIFKVRDINIGYLDVNMERSYGYFKDIKEGKYLFTEYNYFDYENSTYTAKKIKNDKETIYTGNLDGNYFDVLSSLFFYSQNSKEILPKKEIKVLTTKKWELEVINHGIVTVKLEDKKIRAYKVEPKVGDEGIFISKKGKSLYVYISKDDRIPIMLEAEVFLGSVVAKLVKIER